MEPICNIDLPSHPRPLCNFVRHPSYPKFCAPGQKSPINTICTIPAHPTDKCNIEEHPDFPSTVLIERLSNKSVLIIFFSQTDWKDNSPGAKNDLPVCSVPGHPMLLCNHNNHPDYPKFTRNLYFISNQGFIG